MRISLNETNTQTVTQTGRINKPMEMDSFSKRIIIKLLMHRNSCWNCLRTRT